jgi:hypothetical protein
MQHISNSHQQDGFMPPMPALQTPPSPSSHAYSRHISCSNFDHYFQILSESELRFSIVTSARSAISKVTPPDSSFVAVVTVSVPLTSSITLSSTFSTTAQLQASASGLLDCVSDGFAAQITRFQAGGKIVFLSLGATYSETGVPSSERAQELAQTLFLG